MEKCSHCKKITNDYIKQSSRINKKGEKVYYYWCNPCNTERLRKYRKTEIGRTNVFQAVYRSIIKHQVKQNARANLRYHLQKGNITKPDHCEKCNNTKIEAHHTDYSKPLEVMWLCKRHHREEHDKESKRTNKTNS